MDPMQAAIASNDAKGEFGVWLQPGIGNAYPELKSQLSQLRQKLVGKLTWVPLAWASQVQAIQDANPTVLVKMTPSKRPTGETLPGLPAWLAGNQARIDAWQEIVTAQDKAVVQYAANDAANGKPLLDALYARSDFYNSAPIRALSVAQEALINAPSAISNAAGTLVSDLFGGFLKKAGWVIALGVVGYLLFMNRGKVAKAAGKAL
jgi:hypothetical protein